MLSVKQTIHAAAKRCQYTGVLDLGYALNEILRLCPGYLSDPSVYRCRIQLHDEYSLVFVGMADSPVSTVYKRSAAYYMLPTATPALLCYHDNSAVGVSVRSFCPASMLLSLLDNMILFYTAGAPAEELRLSSGMLITAPSLNTYGGFRLSALDFDKLLLARQEVLDNVNREADLAQPDSR